MAGINKIVKVSLSDQVSEHLRQMISDNEFPVGSKLPSESELANMFGVSRLTVRMALQKLSAQGLTVTRPGDGTFVKKFNIAAYMDEVSSIVMKPEMLDDVLEFRLCIEGEAAKLAMDRITPEDLRRMELLSSKMSGFVYDYEHPKSFNLNEYVELDFKFHLALCKCSHNSLLVLAYSAAKAPVCAYLSSINTIRVKQYHDTHPTVQTVSIEKITVNNGHADLLQALKNRDIETCGKVFQRLASYSIPLNEALS